jgi:osmotically-inducible protein OsmY
MSDDRVLQKHVIDALEFEPSVKAAHIGVSVRDGVVALSGHVDSFVEKFAAERTAQQVKGVTAVAETIEVRLAPDKKLGDDEIAERAARLLHWDVSVPDDRIAIKVEHGIVTLTGQVEWHFQRAEAEYDVRKLGGVRGVINFITVAPKPRTADVRRQIRAALERSATAEADRIAVAVSGGKVMLSGTVAAWNDREVARRAAWSVRGVTEVEDRIKLGRP